jgi:hypothetical protein
VRTTVEACGRSQKLLPSVRSRRVYLWCGDYRNECYKRVQSHKGLTDLMGHRHTEAGNTQTNVKNESETRSRGDLGTLRAVYFASFLCGTWSQHDAVRVLTPNTTIVRHTT